MPADGQPRLKEVAYWYIDYREFANVTKYKLAMIHKGIEEATKHVRGFLFSGFTLARPDAYSSK